MLAYSVLVASHETVDGLYFKVMIFYSVLVSL